MIIDSPHYHQIRVILLKEDLLEDEANIDFNKLHNCTMKPIILILNDNMFNRKFNLKNGMYRNNGEFRKSKSFGISPKISKNVLHTITLKDDIPEVLRIARLVSLRIVERFKHNL
jgi:endonuclease V-like protein UPF0215 family